MQDSLSVPVAPNRASDDFEWQEILAMDSDVEPVMWAIKHLRDVFCSIHGRSASDVAKSVDAKMNGVISALQTMLRKHPTLYTLDLVAALKDLQYKARGNDTEHGRVRERDSTILTSIDQLSAACYTSMNDYSFGAGHPQLEKSKSFENLMSPAVESAMCAQRLAKQQRQRKVPSQSSLEIIDQKLDPGWISMSFELPYGVDEALEKAFAWLAYSEQVCCYVEKRLQLIDQFAKDLYNLSSEANNSILQMHLLSSEFARRSSVAQDVKFAELCATSCQQLQPKQQLESLRARQVEHEKICELLKADWESQQAHITTSDVRHSTDADQLDAIQCKFLSDVRRLICDSETVLRNATGEYFQLLTSSPASVATTSCRKLSDFTFRFEPGELAVPVVPVSEVQRDSVDLDKSTDDDDSQVFDPLSVNVSISKSFDEAESGIQDMKRRSSDSSGNLGSSDSSILVRPVTRRSYEDGDLMSLNDRKPRSLRETMKKLEPVNMGSSRPVSSETRPHPVLTETRPHPVLTAMRTDFLGGGNKAENGRNAHSRHNTVPNKRPVDTAKFYTDELVSAAAAAASEPQLPHVITTSEKFDELFARLQIAKSDKKGETIHGSGYSDMLLGVKMSRSAQTHKFRKMIRLARCRHCDSYIYGNGLQCHSCGLSCHKKCLEELHWECGGQQKILPSGGSQLPTGGAATVNNTAGSAAAGVNNLLLSRHLSRCILEIDERGLDVKGIYRVSAVKSTVDDLCRRIEVDDDAVDMSSLPPHVVAGVLKSVLRQLPEPLLTFDLYEDLVRIVKNEKPGSTTSTCDSLAEVMSRLPLSNFVAAAQLIRHLRRVADHSEENHMSAYNLGLVFGPTLLRSSNEDPNTTGQGVLLEAATRSRIVELLILNAQVVFGGASASHQNVDTANRNDGKTPMAPAQATAPASGSQNPVKITGTRVSPAKTMSVDVLVAELTESNQQPSEKSRGTHAVDVDPEKNPLVTAGGNSHRSPLSRQHALHHKRHMASCKSSSLPVETSYRPVSMTESSVTRVVRSDGDSVSDLLSDDNDDNGLNSPTELCEAVEEENETEDENSTIFCPGRLLATSDSFLCRGLANTVTVSPVIDDDNRNSQRVSTIAEKRESAISRHSDNYEWDDDDMFHKGGDTDEHVLAAVYKL